jgi:SulP family sulfate permease
MEGVLPINQARMSRDMIAGVTLAALAIPEVMGYTILIPMALFTHFGSSRYLVVGADSATAAIMATYEQKQSATGTARERGD